MIATPVSGAAGRLQEQERDATARGRIGWLDIARGLTIILVVIGHVERGLDLARIAHGPVWAWMDYAIYTFHMPAFFLFSGLTAYMSLRKRDSAAFLKDKLWTIVYPYFLWSLIQGFFMYALSSLTTSKETLHGILLIGWQPIGQFWFLYVLMIYQMVGAAMFRYRAMLLGLSACLYVLPAFCPLPDLIHETCHFMIFYTVGFYDLAALIGFMRDRRNVLMAAFAMCFAVATYFSDISDHGNYYSLQSLPSTLFGVGLILAISLALDEGTAQRIAGVLIALGGASMTIYVLHILFGAGMRVLLGKLHIPANAWLYLAASTLVAVTGPYFLHRMLTRFRLLTPLGLAPLRRAPALQEKPA